jgi:hypothetical protein
MGDFLALHEQKTSGQNKFYQRQSMVDNDIRPMNAQGEPTCASEDHTFMNHKPGGPDTYFGWHAMKNFFAW